MVSNFNVLQICSYYLGTRLYQNLFDSLERFDLNERVYVFTDKQNKIERTYPANVHISKCYNKIDRYIFHLKHLKVLRDIQEKLNVEKYDIMHAHSLFSNGYIAYKLSQKYKIPYIVAVRNTDVNLFLNKIIYLRKLGLNILKNAQKIIFLSDSYKKHTIDKFIPEKYKKEVKNKSVIIPNGIDEFWLKNKYRKTTSPEKNKVKLIYAGRIDSNKNIETAVKACRLLIKRGYEINYKVIGKIVNKRYGDLIDKYTFIEYIQHCQKEELIEHYRNSDIFIMPSKHETFGLVYAEAMSQGLPVIYTRGQGFDGQFDEGEVGYSVQYNSEREIVKSIGDIINNYEMISNNCIKKVDRFDWKTIGHSYSKIYENCIDEHNRL